MLAGLGAAEALDGVPGRGEGALVLDVESDLHLLAAVGQAEALDHVELVGVRRLVVVDKAREERPIVSTTSVSPS